MYLSLTTQIYNSVDCGVVLQANNSIVYQLIDSESEKRMDK